MIKLVAADMDGTLLRTDKSMPEDTMAVIRALSQRGVRFAAASGRQYYNLCGLFPDAPADMLYISENGAMVFDGSGTLLDISEIPYEALLEPVRQVRALPDTYVILCGEKGAWLEADEPVFRENAAMYYTRLTRVQDVLEAAKHDRICKIAIFHHKTIESAVYPSLLPFGERFQVALSGDSWVDLMLPGTNKGGAMRHIQQKLGLRLEECMAFGDYLNDLELMQAVGHAYGMEGGHPDLLAVCTHRAPSNDEDGVLRVLKREFCL